MKKKNNAASPCVTLDLFSFFESNMKLRRKAEEKKEKQNEKSQHQYNPIPLCSSNPERDLVMLGPHGIEEVTTRKKETNASTFSLDVEDKLYAPLCGSNKFMVKRKRSVNNSQKNRQVVRKTVKRNSISTTPTSGICSSNSPCSSEKVNLENIRESISQAAKEHFGVTTLSDFQIASIEAIFKGKDVFIIMPTGAGKSLCYQLPPLMHYAKNRFVLVVSPLIALMEDQVLSLTQKNIPAISFSRAPKSTWNRICDGHYRLVYCSPEFIELHLDQLSAMFSKKILFIAIDECHCVSEWGHHFRPSYRGLARLRKHFRNTSFMCLTATATCDVRTDILRTFKLRPSSTLHLRGTINRQNIFYSVYQRRGTILDDFKTLFQLEKSTTCKRPPIDNSCVGPYSSTLVYVTTKQDAETVSETLKTEGLSCAAYHAGLSPSKRSTIHHKFMADDLQVVCATVAFGMGIDKPDVRRIIHWCLPSSLESYAQQSGRAGRDRVMSEAIIIWSDKNVAKTRHILLQQPETGHLSERYKQHLLKLFDTVLEYVNLETKCRREFLLNYFGDTVPDVLEKSVVTLGVCAKVALDQNTVVTRCDLCDTCCKDPSEKNLQIVSLDFTEEAQIIMNCILACKERTGVALPCKVATGSRSKDILSRHLEKTSVFGKGSCKSFEWWKKFLNYLLSKKFIEEKLVQGARGAKGQNHYLAIKLTAQGRNFLKGQQKFIATNPPLALLTYTKRKITSINDENFNKVPPDSKDIEQKQAELRQQLMNLRLIQSREKSCAPYMILPMPSIEFIVRLRPSTLEHLFRYVPQIPSLCSVLFLEKVIQTVCQWATQYNLPQNLVIHDSSMLPNFYQENAKEEPVCYSDDTLSNDSADTFTPCLNTEETNTVSQILENTSDSQDDKQLSLSYELSQSDIADFDQLLPVNF
ncbi:ATP-dependent DNA helicase RecQ-like isoform X2 [Hylaeus volcanicus]|uniref:ATP-dependent DNA helicase RecQ-like isoform X2 n=1 Tax=Hylaeus volcanicus TaxID=313075 RepID=UPI0023B83206|nr:ATP-dependent DNA helicase RecQ-like isoform X2 [Hylaeus volcanicus]